MAKQRINPENLSDLVIYVDESGDHGLDSIDSSYPIFVLVFVIMKKDDYLYKITPDMQNIKFKYWGHDQVVLHEREIRKKIGPFSILLDKMTNSEFMEDINDFISKSPIDVCVSVIDKEKLKNKYKTPFSPYEIALQFCMERLISCLDKHNQEGKRAFLVFESRGKAEDKDLELAFLRIASNKSTWGWRAMDFSRFQLEPVFARKDANAAGLQLADLMARPCGLKVLRSQQENRAYSILREKIAGRFKVYPT